MASETPIDQAKDLQQMLVTYAKQETVEPLKTLGRYLQFGVPGAICIFLSAMFLAIGVLRFFQGVERFSGGSFGSLAPYGFSVVALLVLMGIVGYLMSRAGKRVKS